MIEGLPVSALAGRPAVVRMGEVRRPAPGAGQKDGIMKGLAVFVTACVLLPAVALAVAVPERASTETYRGRIVTEDGSPLPPGLKMLRRVSGEKTRETPVDANGEFSFDTGSGRTSARFSMTVPGFAPFDSIWRKLNQPLKLTLSRGATVRLQLVAPSGTRPVAGFVKLGVPWWDEDEQGTFAVDANGVVTIAHCPLTTVNLDVFVPGFEELRVHRLVRGDISLDVPLQVAKVTRFRIVSAKDGRPIARARVHFFSRTRGDSFLSPFRYYGNDWVWGESNADGQVELTTLRAIDPVPSNVPGPAIYAFRIEAPDHAPHYIGNVRAGRDFGDIQLGDALEVRGEIIRDAQKPEEISLQIRQPTVAQGGDDGRGGWNTMEPVEVAGKLTFHLTELHTGPLDMFIVYTVPPEDPDSGRRRVQQLQFHGMLTGNSSNLVITRKSVVPGDSFLTARRSSLFPVDEHPPSNVPGAVVAQLTTQWTMTETDDDTVELKITQPTRDTLFAWSSTAPVRHSMGHVNWRVFVLRDGTMFVPGGSNRTAGTHHKLSATELQELNRLLEQHHELFGRQTPAELPKFASWNNGYETLSYSKDGKTQSFTSWYGLERHVAVGEYDTAEPQTEIKEFVSRLMTNAACGGRETLAKYRKVANRALIRAIPSAKPFPDDGWSSTTNKTDGTREISFANTAERTRVEVIHPAFGEIYVESIRQFDKRVDFDSNSLE